MKINSENTNINYELLKNQLEKLQTKGDKTARRKQNITLSSNNRSNKGEQTANIKSSDIFTNKLISLLDTLNPTERELLINNIIKNNLSFDIDKITGLVSFLNKTPEEDHNSIIRAFIILMKNNLPLNMLLKNADGNIKNSSSQLQSTSDPNFANASSSSDVIKLLEKLADNFNQNKGLTALLNELQQTSSEKQSDNSLISTLKQLIIDPEKAGVNLAEQLNEFPQKLSNLMQLLQEQSGKQEQQILQHLIGQDIINHQDKNILLHLEIPLFFHQYNKSLPAYLTIKRDNNKSESGEANPEKDTYKISFIISLDKRGVIKSDSYISKGRIKIFFRCSKEETADIIDSKFLSLQEKLEKIGFNVEKPVIEDDKIISEDIEALIGNEIIPGEKLSGEFLHIDIKV